MATDEGFEDLINTLATIAADPTRVPGSRVELTFFVYPGGSGQFLVVDGIGNDVGTFNGPHTAAELLREFIKLNAK